MTVKAPENSTMPQVNNQDFDRIYRMGYQAAFDRLNAILYPEGHDRARKCICDVCQGHEMIRDRCACATCVTFELFRQEIEQGIQAKTKYVPDQD